MIHAILPVGMLQCNCSVLGDETSREAIVVDPGDEIDQILQILAHHQLSVKAIVITHAHIDHIGGAQKLKAATGAPVYMNENDSPLYDTLDAQAGWLGIPTPERTQIDSPLRDGDSLQLGPAELHAMHTPGHTQGSVSLWIPLENKLLAGDTLFRDSIGRTDLPGGDGRQILRSIHDKLLPLPDDAIVIPGHGANTTIGREKRFNPFLRNLCLLLCVGLLGTGLAKGQSGESGQRVSITPRVPRVIGSLPRPTFRLAVNLIRIPVTVTDLRDRLVMGLPKTSFRIFEDNVEQQVAAFWMADGPVSAGIVFDGSGSMRTRIDESRAAVGQFFQTCDRRDEFFLVRFSDRAELVTPWTHESDEISRALTGIRPNGWTAMIDGIRLSLEEMRHASNPRRILLVLSDGGDNNSRYSQAELLSILREADVRIWAVGLFERPRYLQKLADETGGRVVWVHKLAELPTAMERLSRMIRNEYVIGYFSDHAQNDGRYHKVRIEVQAPPEMKQVRATWREGYIAP